MSCIAANEDAPIAKLIRDQPVAHSNTASTMVGRSPNFIVNSFLVSS